MKIFEKIGNASGDLIGEVCQQGDAKSRQSVRMAGDRITMHALSPRCASLRLHGVPYARRSLSPFPAAACATIHACASAAGNARL